MSLIGRQKGHRSLSENLSAVEFLPEHDYVFLLFVISIVHEVQQNNKK